MENVIVATIICYNADETAFITTNGFDKRLVSVSKPYNAGDTVLYHAETNQVIG